MVTGPMPRKGNSRISGSASGAGARVGTLAGCSTLLPIFLLHFFHLNPIDPFSKCFVAGKDHFISGFTHGHFLPSFQLVHVFKYKFGLLGIQAPDAPTYASSKPRDPFLSILILNLNLVAADRSRLLKEFHQHSIAPISRCGNDSVSPTVAISIKLANHATCDFPRSAEITVEIRSSEVATRPKCATPNVGLSALIFLYLSIALSN